MAPPLALLQSLGEALLSDLEDLDWLLQLVSALQELDWLSKVAPPSTLLRFWGEELVSALENLDRCLQGELPLSLVVPLILFR